MSQNPLDRIKNVDWRGLVKTATNKVKQYTMNLSPLEIAVEEATNMDSWGPHGSAMNDIAEACYDSEGYRQVLGVIARRLQEKDERWRMCYKALLLLDFLLKHGPPNIADDVMKSMSVLEKLQDFQYKDANGKDHGANVRHRALEIMALVNDPVKLQEEREKASINKAKYIGVSGEALRTGGFGGGKSTSSFHGTGSALTTSSRIQHNESTSVSNPSWQHKTTRHEAYDRRSPSISPRLRIEESRVGTESSNDAVAATRARIQKLKLEKQSSPRGEGAELVGQKAAEKKKLTLGDVHVNPKIAASLGLKPVKKLYTKDTADKNAKLTTNSSTKPDAGGENDLLGLGTVDDTVPEEKSNDNEGAGASANFADWNAFDQQPPDTSAQTRGIADSHLQVKELAGSDPFDDLTTARSVHSNLAVGRGRETALPEDMFSSLSAAPLSTKRAEKTTSDQDLFADLLT